MDLKGWKATLEVPHGTGCSPQAVSLSNPYSLSRFTPRSCRHWSKNLSSPHGCERNSTHLGKPAADVATARRDNTSMGPWSPHLQLFKYMAELGRSQAKSSQS